jgi:hypothetical protein
MPQRNPQGSDRSLQQLSKKALQIVVGGDAGEDFGENWKFKRQWQRKEEKGFKPGEGIRRRQTYEEDIIDNIVKTNDINAFSSSVLTRS